MPTDTLRLDIWGGPLDGRDVPEDDVGLLIRAARSGHVYRRVVDDSGALYWRYCGLRSLPWPRDAVIERSAERGWVRVTVHG